MTPKFAQAVDPVFLHVLDLIDRIGRNERTSAADERIRIIALIDQAEALIGAGQEWDLAKYAIVSWVDEVLVDTPWEGQEWWSNNVLEMALFTTRACYEQFFVRAKEASTLDRRDALEVFYVCAVLGFRGLYREPELSAVAIQSHGLPSDLETWAKQTAMSIRLGQGRPPLAGPQREIAGAPPMGSKPVVAWSWLAAVLLMAANVIYYVLYFRQG